jgi:hypothetical protein
MYAGNEPWRPSVLDVGQDDYYHAHRLGCLELAESRYLEVNAPAPGPASTKRKLTVTLVGPGRVRSAPAGIACPRRCSASFATGTHVVLRATPAKRARFTGWSGACRGTSTCHVHLTKVRSVRARFRR